MNRTKIEWCDYTWNPVKGCTPVSDGCKNCYALGMCRRFGWDTSPTYYYERMSELDHYKGGRALVFAVSMGDLFHEYLPNSMIINILNKMYLARNKGLEFVVLTKRPSRMEYIMSSIGIDQDTDSLVYDPLVKHNFIIPNIWFGVSVENRDTLHRIQNLSGFKAKVKVVSFEPLLGSVNGTIEQYFDDENMRPDWVIVGAETGIRRRKYDSNWAQYIYEICRKYYVPFFFKRNGNGGPTLNGKIVREFPYCWDV